MKNMENKNKKTRKEELKSAIKGNIIIAAVFQLFPIVGIFFALFCTADRIGSIVCLAISILPAEAVALALLLQNRKFKQQIKEEELHPTVNAEYAPTLFKNDGYTYEKACELYCKQFEKKPGKLTKEDENNIWHYALDDFAYLFMWVIENDYYQPSKEFDEDTAKEIKDFISLIKKRKELPTTYLISNDYFMEDEVKKKARSFVADYFNGSYIEDVKKFAAKHLESELYGFPFRFEDYDIFKTRIDEAYKTYTDNKTKEE